MSNYYARLEAGHRGGAQPYLSPAAAADAVAAYNAAQARVPLSLLGANEPTVVGAVNNPFGQLLSRLFGGIVCGVSLTWRNDRTHRLVFEIDVPSDMSYAVVAENMQRLSQELSSPARPVARSRRRLLRLEEEA